MRKHGNNHLNIQCKKAISCRIQVISTIKYEQKMHQVCMK